MRSYLTRKDKNEEKLDAFIADTSQETMPLRLYSREIKYIPQLYPNLTVEKGNRFQDTDLWECVIRKN